MRKIGIIFSLLSLGSVYADTVSTSQNESNEYAAFQQFDRQYSLGLGATSGNLAAPGSSGGTFKAVAMNLEVERLFNVGVWMDVNGYLYTSYNQNPSEDPAVQLFGQLTGSSPQFGGLNAKVGYAFPLIKDQLMLTPYGELGRNVNFSSYTLQGTTNSNLTSDYYWTYGIGARLEYRLDDTFDFYLDQNMVYNNSQAPMTQGLAQANYYANTTLLGAKFNVWRKLQLGAQVYYNNYYYPTALVSVNPASYSSTSNVLVPTSSVGGQLSVGLTY
ncbi:MAG: hypothetical protein EKK57_06840 [Proteobacteria bacterium]|nr:MAG: hypothetical protein EKK57_06840 [Pseudomonadota bacterium]